MTSTAQRVERLPDGSCYTAIPSVYVPPYWVPACLFDRGSARPLGGRSTLCASLLLDKTL